MPRVLRYTFIVALVAIGVMVAIAPLTVSADILPSCNETYGQVLGFGDYKICGLCDFWHLANNVVNFLLFTVSIPLLTIVMLYGGTMMVISGGNPGNISKGKTAMTNAIVGLLIAFCAWAVVNTFVHTLANGELAGAWSKIPECVKPDTTPIGGLVGFSAGSGIRNRLLDDDGYQDGYQVNDPATQALKDRGRGSISDVTPNTGSIATVMDRLKAYDGQCNGMPFADFVIQESNRNGVDPDRVFSVIAAESGGRATVGSPAGAIGLMQMLPSTAARFGISSADLTNPCRNVQGGTAYYGELNRKFGSYDLASAAYNGGPGANAASQDCSGGSPSVYRWRCAWDGPGCYPAATTGNTSCTPNTGYRETRQYVCNIRAFEAQKKNKSAPTCDDIEAR